MFDVFMKIYDNSKKYFFFAHNYHISKKDLIGSGNIPAGTESEGRFIRKGDSVEWLGCHLSENFRSQYYAIGNIFIDGSYIETFDLIEQNHQAGKNTKYKMVKGSDLYIIVWDTPIVGKIDSFSLSEGLTIYNDPSQPFDAIMVIKYETALKLISYD